MTRIVRASAIRTKTTATRTTINSTTADLLLDHQGGCALDLHDLDARPGLEHLIVEIGARGPLLAAQADAPADGVDPLQDDGVRADERLRSRTDRSGKSQVPA